MLAADEPQESGTHTGDEAAELHLLIHAGSDDDAHPRPMLMSRLGGVCLYRPAGLQFRQLWFGVRLKASPPTADYEAFGDHARH